jgi:hypothetical protein
MELKKVWKEALFLWAPAFKRGWAWFVFAQFVTVMSSLAASVLQRYNEHYLIPGVAFLVVADLAMSIFGLVIANQIIDDVKHGRPTNLSVSLRENFKYIFINFARSLLKTLLGVILLVVPGVVILVRLTFVPYIVLFDPEFKLGHVDALKRSEDLVKGRFWKISGILILCFLLSMVPEFWMSAIPIFERPFAFVMVYFLGIVLGLFGDIVIYCVYQKLV